MVDEHPVNGHCLCGRVRLRIDALERDVVYCHCSQCRRQSGHYYAATATTIDRMRIEGEQHLTWYAASEEAQRGFCRHCGSLLFWKPDTGNRISVLAGCLDAPTRLRSKSHIFVADKGDYYELDDGLPLYAADDGPTQSPMKARPNTPTQTDE